MKIENTKALRNEILDKIETDGVKLSEFNKDQQENIIKAYAAVILSSK